MTVWSTGCDCQAFPGDGLVNRLRLPSVSGAGQFQGKTLDYKIDLQTGKYVYSCPLNPTPDYKLVVK